MTVDISTNLSCEARSLSKLEMEALERDTLQAHAILEDAFRDTPQYIHRKAVSGNSQV